MSTPNPLSLMSTPNPLNRDPSPFSKDPPFIEPERVFQAELLADQAREVTRQDQFRGSDRHTVGALGTE